MIRIVLLGGGNVAYHLATALLNAPHISLIQVYNRDIQAIEYLQNNTCITDSIAELKEADIYIICISDYAIPEITSQIKSRNALLVHTSGSTPLDVLHLHHRRGVFYPLQTFSKNKPVDFTSIPLCLEANTKTDLQLLKKLAFAISTKIFYVDSQQRKQLHTAAVFVSNFVNHLYYIGGELCKQNNIEPEILQPLIQETAQKIITLSPKEAQTGPARRGDKKIVDKHLASLASSYQKIYKLLSQSIAHTYGKKL